LLSCESSIVGFLDDLKRQAGDLQARQNIDTAALERNGMLVESACKNVFQYWVDLVKQLNVINPPARARYAFDTKTVFDGLKFSGFRTDVRRKRLRGEDVTDHIALLCVLSTGQRLSMMKNFPTDIERLEARIAQSGVVCRPETVRNPETGKLIEMRYEFDADIAAGARVVPDHDNGTLEFTIQNLDGLGSVVAQFNALEIGSKRLDELAKWLVGQPHDFLAGALSVRQIEPR
jgi:hypothetical protein